MEGKILVITIQSRFLNLKSYWYLTLAQYFQITQASHNLGKQALDCFAITLLKDLVNPKHLLEWQLSHPLKIFLFDLFSQLPFTWQGNCEHKHTPPEPEGTCIFTGKLTIHLDACCTLEAENQEEFLIFFNFFFKSQLPVGLEAKGSSVKPFSLYEYFCS